MSRTLVRLTRGLFFQRLKRFSLAMLCPNSRSVLFTDPLHSSRELQLLKTDSENDAYFTNKRKTVPGFEELQHRTIFQEMAVRQTVGVAKEVGYTPTPKLVSLSVTGHNRLYGSQATEDGFGVAKTRNTQRTDEAHLKRLTNCSGPAVCCLKIIGTRRSRWLRK